MLACFLQALYREAFPIHFLQEVEKNTRAEHTIDVVSSSVVENYSKACQNDSRLGPKWHMTNFI